MPNHIHEIINRRGEPCVRPNQPTTGVAGEHNRDEHNRVGHNQGEHKVRPYGALDGRVGRIIQEFKSIVMVEHIRGVKKMITGNGLMANRNKHSQPRHWLSVFKENNYE